MCSEITVNSPGNPRSKYLSRSKRKGCGGKDLQRRKVLSLEWREGVGDGIPTNYSKYDCWLWRCVNGCQWIGWRRGVVAAPQPSSSSSSSGLNPLICLPKRLSLSVFTFHSFFFAFLSCWFRAVDTRTADWCRLLSARKIASRIVSYRIVGVAR